MVTLRRSRRHRLRAHRRSLADLATAEREENEQNPAKEIALLNTQSGLAEPTGMLRDHPRRTAPSWFLGVPTGNLGSLDFELPPELEASEPPEARGLRRDDVRLMVSYMGDDSIVHSRFADLPQFIRAGDTLVVNTSGTMNAALPAERSDGTPLTVHLSTHLPADLWVVELRSSSGDEPILDGKSGETLSLPEGASMVLQTPYLSERRQRDEESNRLWISTMNLSV